MVLVRRLHRDPSPSPSSFPPASEFQLCRSLDKEEDDAEVGGRGAESDGPSEGDEEDEEEKWFPPPLPLLWSPAEGEGASVEVRVGAERRRRRRKRRGEEEAARGNGEEGGNGVMLDDPFVACSMEGRCKKGGPLSGTGFGKKGVKGFV